jgi:GNAT superfamily N-acetyltransferase
MKGTIREATLEDAAAIARVHVVSWQAAYRGIMLDELLDNLSVSDRTADWKKRLQNAESRRNFVLEIEATIEGWISLGPARDGDKTSLCGEIYGIYLTSEWWSKGWGWQLYVFAENVLREGHFNNVTVWVLEANSRARRFYEKAGYAPDGRTTAFGQGLPEMRYEKKLD